MHRGGFGMILWADSFDHYGTTESNMTDGAWSSVPIEWTIDNAQARTGTYSMKNSSGGGGGALRRQFGSALPAAGVGYACFVDSIPSFNNSTVLHSFRDAANNPNIEITLQSTGAIAAIRGDQSSGTVLDTSATLVPANSWNHIEAFVSIDAAIGSVEVRLNGVTILNLAGINTISADAEVSGATNGGLAEVSQWSTRHILSDGSTRWIDDIVAWEAGTTGSPNDDFVGDKKVFTQFPDADTADADWVPLTGADMFAMVDEADPDGDTSYDESTTAGDVMGLSFPDANAATIAIAAVIVAHKSKKTDAGTCNVQTSIVSSGDEEVGADNPMTTAYTLNQDVFELDPHTDAPWTLPGVNAMTVKLTRTA